MHSAVLKRLLFGAALVLGPGLAWRVLSAGRTAPLAPRSASPAVIAELTASEPRSLHVEVPQLGPGDAELSFVEFADFQSDDCARAAPMPRMLQRLFPERVRFAFRQYPSPTHPDAHLAAEASLAAAAQGKFWEYYDRLFANPHDLGRAALERYAREIGLEMPAFQRALDQRSFAPDVDADIELGRRMRALPVPSLFVNGKRVNVPYGVAELQELVNGK